MRTIALGICILVSLHVAAQRQCGTQSYLEDQKSSNPHLATKLAGIEYFIQLQKENTRLNGEGTSRASGVIQVPVVVHVLYNTASQNISDAQIKTQIDALNRDFRRTNPDSMNTPERFRFLAADAEIEFKLATADPGGRPTTGIIRKQTNVGYWQTDDKIKFNSQGGDDAWDSRYFLNIWVGNLQMVIGYSTSPGAPVEKNGVVIATSVFGTINTDAVYNKGRTAVHEIGHWLGLKHIWGDYYCGDDMVDDTPKQGNFTPGCPTSFRTSCDNASTGDMYMNYMDYTNDACLNLFTIGQKGRMRSLFYDGGPRASLLNSKGLAQPWVEEAPREEPISLSRIYPNPATGTITLNLEKSWTGKMVYFINTNGVIVFSIKISSGTQTVNLSQLKPGMYILQAENEGGKWSERLIKL